MPRPRETRSRDWCPTRSPFRRQSRSTGLGIDRGVGHGQPSRPPRSCAGPGGLAGRSRGGNWSAMLFTGHLASIRTVLTCILPATQQFGAIMSTLQTTSCPNGTGRGGGNPPQHPQRRETRRASAAPQVPPSLRRLRPGGDSRSEIVGQEDFRRKQCHPNIRAEVLPGMPGQFA